MKTLFGILAISILSIVLITLVYDQKTPLSEIPQSQRCEEMCHRRDGREIEDLKGKTKDEIRQILGSPQNLDEDSQVWIWLFDWDEYVTRGLSKDWRTMAKNSPGDGLWVSFDSKGQANVHFPYSLSAWDPLLEKVE